MLKYIILFLVLLFNNSSIAYSQICREGLQFYPNFYVDSLGYKSNNNGKTLELVNGYCDCPSGMVPNYEFNTGKAITPCISILTINP